MNDSLKQSGRMWKLGFFLLGLVMLALGVVGAFLPVMPSTIFLIFAAGCFGRSSPRLEAWMLAHPRFGSALIAWREHGAVSRQSKILACSGMALGYALFWIGSHPAVWLAVLVAIFMAGSAAYVATRPEPAAPNGI
tara:strand:+ start:1322 stop:1729 length:408 start_codon:yes stop_codon:yes gene_type:complete